MAADGDAEAAKAREKAIHDLLVLCAEREVPIPDEMRAALLGEEYIRKEGKDEEPKNLMDSLLEDRAAALAEEQEDEIVKEIRETLESVKLTFGKFSLQVKDASYTVTNLYNPDDFTTGEDGSQHRKQKIGTVYNVSVFGALFDKLKKLFKTGTCMMKPIEEEKVISKGVNLSFKSSKMYLVLGAPGSGKSTVMKMIANNLRQDKRHILGGTVTANGVEASEEGIYWQNLVSYIDQIDRLHAYLTVFETLNFAWECRSGSTHAKPYFDMDDPEVKKKVEQLDKDRHMVNIIMQALAIARVRDTFVGNNTSVRGVSGGEKKRVTVGEMMTTGTPIHCCDEISTGLDSATTFDIVKLLGIVARLTGTIKIVSLLQPSPETVALFDELILVDSGQVIYSGPLEDVKDHFASLGYHCPDRMDVADWLVSLATKDGKNYLVPKEGEEATHLTADEFRVKFEESPRYKELLDSMDEPITDEMRQQVDALAYVRYQNKWYNSLKIVVQREMLLWWRDKYQLKARIMQDLIMGIIAGTLFWQASDDPSSVLGILFQSMFFVCIGAMLKVPEQFEPRSIFYKHQDANFFPTWTFVVGRTLGGLPTSLIDGVLYGTIIYWFVGLAHNDGASVANYFVFMLVILASSMVAGIVFSIFSATVNDKNTAQACMSVTIVLLVLFSGFTVQPDVIPDYWIWAYWINMFAWFFRALVVNEYQSGKYDEEQANGLTEGENILVLFGFTLNDEPFEYEWVWYGVCFGIFAALLCVVLQILFLSVWRFETGKSLDSGEHVPPAPDESDPVEIPFQRVNLTFKDIHYTVKASTHDEYLELLKGIDGFVEAGKMTALMGSSGAGKTTLMDVLSLRKSSGEITGEVTLNGHPQEAKSFRRCTGYVEQFDEQSPQLTIRETVEFSARLRLEESDPAVTPESIERFVNQTLDMLELREEEHLQVGSDLIGGLSFEQKKRLSIAVELVSNPSILFLDEPTSGLDARAASIIMRGLKRISLMGRAVCATIHQPSIAIFNSFDTLLLLKRGGETVFFGDLGEESSSLIEYFERYEASPKIRPGENPATWMLTCIGAGGSSGQKAFDYAGSYQQSKLKEEAVRKIDEFCATSSDENNVSFPHKYATSSKTQKWAVMRRTFTVYWRSPSYNLLRLMVSVIVALLFGSVFASQRVPQNEADMNSRITSIFITAVFLAVNSYNTVLAVFETERNMFYRHKAALMYDQRAILASYTWAEIPFILLSSMLFCISFYFLVGFSTEADKFFLYYLFFTLNMGNFTFLGQMFMSLVRDSITAQGFGGLLISSTVLFSGILIRPSNIPNFWVWAYWVFPGHYVMEGLIMSQFKDDDTQIEASFGSAYFESLVAAGRCDETSTQCFGTAWEWVLVAFGENWSTDHIPWNILYLIGLAILSRLVTYYALTNFNYLAK